MHGRYDTDILKMCMKKFNAEKIFLTNLQGFDLHLRGVYLACSQFLVSPFLSQLGSQLSDMECMCNRGK